MDTEIDDLSFELPNVGPGPDSVTLEELATDSDAVVLLFMRDHYCMKCREQARDVAERYDEFDEQNAEVVTVLPEAPKTARNWSERYDLPYPMLADPEQEVGDQYDQPVRFGFVGKLSDFLGRMPLAMTLDTRDGIEVIDIHEGSHPADRPTPDDLLATIPA